MRKPTLTTLTTRLSAMEHAVLPTPLDQWQLNGHQAAAPALPGVAPQPRRPDDGQPARLLGHTHEAKKVTAQC